MCECTVARGGFAKEQSLAQSLIAYGIHICMCEASPWESVAGATSVVHGCGCGVFVGVRDDDVVGGGARVRVEGEYGCQADGHAH